MTAPSIVDYTTVIDLASATSRNIDTPTHSSGDAIYIAFATDEPSDTITVSGFTVIYSDASIDGAATFGLFRKVAGGSEPANYAIATVGSERGVGFCWSVSGDNGIDAQATPSTGNSGTATVPAITSTVADCLRISIVATDRQSIPHGTASTHTKLDEIDALSAAAMSVHYKTLASAGTDSSQTVSLTTAEQWIGVTITIAPVASGYDDLVASATFFTLTGQSATLLHGRNVTANQSTFTLTGQSANLLYGRSIAALQSTFALTGQDVSYLRGYVVGAVQASFALSDNTASLIADRIVIGDQGIATLTGQTAILRYGRSIAANQSTFTLTGQNIAFLRDYVLSATQSSFALSDNNVSFSHDRVIQAVSAAYTLTGIDVNLTYSESGSYDITAELGSIALTGQNAGMIVARLLTADQSSIALTGQNVPLLHDRKIAAIQASYALAGQSIGLLTHRRIDADQSSIIATWSTTLFLRTWLIVASQDTFTLTGQTVTLTYSGITLTPVHRTYVIDAENRIYVVNSENRTYLIEV